MPIYEFECDDCRKRSEIFVKSKDEAIRCPACGGTRLTKLLSAFATQGGEKAHGHSAEGCSCCPAAGSCPTAQDS